MAEWLDTTMIEGAGGIVTCDIGGETRIAVVYRSRHDGEWGLPKGKRKKDESWQQTALREVDEEINVKPVIVGLAGSTFYVVGDSPKLVVFWRMHLDGTPPCFKPNDEVQVLEWLPPDQAVKRLTHSEEANVVRNVFPNSAECRPKRAGGLGRLCVSILRKRPLRRLASDIAAYKMELRCGANSAVGAELVRAAERAARNGDIDAGWKHLQSARRVELASADPDRLKAEAIAIRNEAEDKLNPWRKKAVGELLTITAGTALRAQDVCEAARLRDDHFNNGAYKDGLLRTNALLLAVCLFGAVLILLSLGYAEYLPPRAAGQGNVFSTLLSLSALGWLGATISAITNLPSVDKSARIPELVSDFRITMLRLLMGPASAIVLYFASQTELAKSLFNMQGNNGGYLILIIAFAGGFSERLVLRVAQSFDKPSK